jgi:hypothetical protein
MQIGLQTTLTPFDGNFVKFLPVVEKAMIAPDLDLPPVSSHAGRSRLRGRTVPDIRPFRHEIQGARAPKA